MTLSLKRKLTALALALGALAAGAYAWKALRPSGPGDGFASGNGRIEATEIDVATKLGGRVQDILVDEGDFVTAGQTLAHMQVQTLEAQRDEARAQAPAVHHRRRQRRRRRWRCVESDQAGRAGPGRAARERTRRRAAAPGPLGDAGARRRLVGAGTRR